MNDPTRHSITRCPECGNNGKTVKRITLESLLVPSVVEQIGNERYRFCDTLDCQTVYFGENGTFFVKDDLAVRVGVKEHSAPRHVCYCFDHTIEEIDAEIKKTGASTVLDDIKDRMKTACWCETKSPRGACCLSTVGKYVKLSFEATGESLSTSSHRDDFEDCCDTSEQESSPVGEKNSAEADCCTTTDADAKSDYQPERTAMFAVGGSAITSLAASACCWIPLALIGLGVSTGGVSAWFEQYRLLFLGLTAILLGTGFYLVYFRKSCCVPGSTCAKPNIKLQRFNRGMLWAATGVVIVTAAFPKYVGYLMPDGNSSQIISPLKNVSTAVLPISGMTCEACTIHIKNELSKVPGILGAKVSYTQGNASISFDPQSPPSETDVKNAIEKAGYKGETSAINK